MSRKTPFKHIVKMHTRSGGVKVNPYWRGRGQKLLSTNKSVPSYFGSPVEYVKDSYGIEYKIVDGTAYHIDTPDIVVKILEDNRKNHRGKRLRLWYGNSKTGEDWEESYATTGYIGRSTGLVKIPLLIHDTRGWGGPGLLDDTIIKIAETKEPHRVLYQHPDFHKKEGNN
jgi:hypothetical protein